MSKRLIQSLLVTLSLGLFTACGGTPFKANPSQTQPVDLNNYVPKVDSFVVLLDTSGSMTDDGASQTKMQTAADLVANFGGAVPDVDFNAGMVIFGKGAGTCMGNGVARKIYGMTTFDQAGFQRALTSIDCARSTTPIVEAVDLTTGMLAEDAGQIAVVVFSDTKWDSVDGVGAAVNALKEQHGERICFHIVKIGNHTGSDALLNKIAGGNNCGGVTAAADLAAPAAMTAYAADVLMAPVMYERHSLSAMTLFDFDSAVLKPAGKAELDKLGIYIRDKGIKVNGINVVGHTCSIGSDQYNKALSERRAMAVKNFLVSRGVNAGMIKASGMGEADPVASNDTEAGRQQNRRVDVHIGTAGTTR